ncbi:hypothetical protein [Azohydromonas aeria]|uniref:hypothetical protein n=1 Tax=Azohydromonas aeria TaxID=2590212 RepID=UPI0012F81B27|nr:hypothetical protein [Azohydromonas aeria]
MTTPAAAAAQPDPQPPAAPVPAPGDAAAARLAHLFRSSTRAGRVHPLQPLLQRYRAGEAT